MKTKEKNNDDLYVEYVFESASGASISSRFEEESNTYVVHDWYNQSHNIKIPDGKIGLKIINNNRIAYLVDGKYHKENGFAYKSESSTRYYKHGQLHRIGGPAKIINDLGYFVDEYYVNGKKIPNNANFPIINRYTIINKVPITNITVMNAMMFDREYGNFIKTIYKFFSNVKMTPQQRKEKIVEITKFLSKEPRAKAFKKTFKEKPFRGLPKNYNPVAPPYCVWFK